MSMESAQDFFARLKSDQELGVKLAMAADDAARLKIAQGAGFSFTLEELEAARDELDDATLDEVAGGLMAQGQDGRWQERPMHTEGDGSGLVECGREANSWGLPACHSDQGPI